MQRDAEAEALRLAIREKERRRALVALDRTIHEMAESWTQPHVVDAKLAKRFRDEVERVRRAWKD